MDSEVDPRLEKTRHIKYWTRCLKTFLPHQYTGNDSNRMYLGFFILSALDLLDALTSACTEDERTGYIDWIYRCQHPNGGFRMWPGTDLGDRANESNAKWDPANVPATYFALAALLVLRDDFKRVRRKQTLQWLCEMQRPDGSFGEYLVDGRIEGGRDPRAVYCACGARYILRGMQDGVLIVGDDKIEDFNINAMVACIRGAESYDGGIADENLHEPHAGYTFCSLGALSFVNRLNGPNDTSNDPTLAPVNPQEVVWWLVNRQTDLLDPDANLDSEFLGSQRSAKLDPLEFQRLSAQRTSDTSLSSPFASNIDCAGMNGRTNKVADTCYAFWAGASLHILAQPTLYDREGVQKYLLEKTQHPVLGGFGKFPGDLPDLYHSYLGLAALSLTDSQEVKELDACMCISKEAKARLHSIWASGDD